MRFAVLLGTLAVAAALTPIYCAGDRRPGQVLCQNVSEYGGRSLILRPSGRLVR